MASITHRQDCNRSATLVTSGTAVTGVFPGTPTSGDQILMTLISIAAYPHFSDISLVSGLGVTTWTRANAIQPSSGYDDETWTGVTNGTSNNLTVTTTSGSQWMCQGSEFIGVGSVGTAVSNSGSSTAPSQAVTVVAGGAAFISASGTVFSAAPSGSWTSLTALDAAGVGSAWQLSASGTTLTGTWTQSSGTWATTGVALAPPPAAPSTPTGLSATASGVDIDLSWSAGAGGGPVTSYTVLRGTTSGGETSYATGVLTTSYVDTAATPGQIYYYKVEAVGTGGTSSASTEANATTSVPAPLGLIAIGGSQIALEWTAPSPLITSYTLLRGTTSGGETSYVTGISGSATSYTDSGVSAGTRYYYTLEAVTSGGTSPSSNEATAPAGPAVGYSLQVAFEANTFDPASSLVWSDLAKWSRSEQSTTGRSHPLDRIAPGTLTAVLDDRGGHFSPWNTMSEFAGATGYGLAAGKPVRWVANDGGTLYPLWWGYSTGWKPVLTDPLNQDTTLSASDILDLLNLRYLANNQLFADAILAYSPSCFFRLNDYPTAGAVDANWNPMDSSGNGVSATVYLTSTSTTNAVGVQGPVLYDSSTCIDLAGANGADNAFLFISGGPTAATGFFQFQLDSGVSTAVLAVPVSTGTTIPGVYLQVASGVFGLAYSNGAGGATLEESGPTVEPGTWHTCAWTILGTTISVWLDGVFLWSYTNAAINDTDLGPFGGLTVSGGGSAPGATSAEAQAQLANVAVFPTVLTSAEIQALTTLATYFQNVELSGTRVAKVLTVALGATAYANLATDIEPGTVYVGVESNPTLQTTALSYLQNVVDTEDGLLFQGPDGVLNFYQRSHPRTASSSTTSQGTIGDNASTSYHYLFQGLDLSLDDQDLYNDVQVMVTSGTSSLTQTGTPTATTAPTLFETINSTAGDIQSTRVLQRSGNIAASYADAQILSARLAARYATPPPGNARPKAIPMSSATTANLPQMLGRRLWDRVTIQRQNANSSQYSEDSLIEQVNHSRKADPGELVTTWGCNPWGVLYPSVSISHVNAWHGTALNSLTVDPATVGDLMVVWLAGLDVVSFIISGGGVEEWNILDSYTPGGTTTLMAWGLVTTAGSAPLDLAYYTVSGGTVVTNTIGYAMVDEFSAGTPAATWTPDPGVVGTTTTVTGATLTPSTSLGELAYYGWWASSPPSAGSTTGFHYETNSDTAIAYDLNVTGAVTPSVGSAGQAGIGALFQAVV